MPTRESTLARARVAPEASQASVSYEGSRMAAGQRSAFEPGRSAANPPALHFLNARTPERRGHSKLAVGKWDEPSEREAQHVADEVMDSIHTERDAASPVAEFSAQSISQVSASGCACGGHSGSPCAECSKKAALQRSTDGGTASSTTDGGTTESGIAAAIHEVLRSPGQPLSAGTRAAMEPRFGHDFSRVHIHADTQAAESARSVSAKAYTVGSHVVFGRDRYAPQSIEGQRLIAHELTHVVQQAGVPLGACYSAIRTLICRNYPMSN